MESISINNWFWIQWKDHIISFNYLGLPKGVHFTIAFNENSSFINLHLTKNSSSENNHQKPKIEICRISKNDFFEIAPKISIGLLFHILEEVPNPKKYQDQYFISFEEIEKEGTHKGIGKELFDNFKDISKLKQKNRLKIKGDIENKLELFSENVTVQNLIMEKINFFDNSLKSKGGILFSENEILSLFKIQDKCFKLNTDVDWKPILKEIFGTQLYNHLEKYILESIKRIEKANSYSDCENFEKPITLEKQLPAANSK